MQMMTVLYIFVRMKRLVKIIGSNKQGLHIVNSYQLLKNGKLHPHFGTPIWNHTLVLEPYGYAAILGK